MSYTNGKIRSALVSIFQREGLTLKDATKKANKYTDELHDAVTEPEVKTPTSVPKKLASRVDTKRVLSVRKRVFEALTSSSDCHRSGCHGR